MSIRELLRKSSLLVGLVHELRKLRLSLNQPNTRRAIARYCRENEVRLLHLGAGARTHIGWIGTDISPGSKQIAWLDATKAFPIDSRSFDYILCEHMIEHIPWASALSMLKECNRVLRPGGIIRIATPDLSVLFDLYHKPLTPDGQNYLRWIVDHYIAGKDSYEPIFVINNAFRNWGHQFLYDEAALRAILTAAGFSEIVRCSVHESRHAPLRGIESHGRNIGNEDINRFETMILEASTSS